MTVVLGTRMVKKKPAMKALMGFVNVALMRLQDFGMLKIAVMYRSTPQRAMTRVAPPSIRPIQAGMNLRMRSTQGVATSRRSGIYLSQVALTKMVLPLKAMSVKTPKKSSAG